ncbi:MAG: 4Fe-4S ferredoxin [Treponema sp.]|nr:4Fe-4S ferredoxin [Treponema sp.]
MRVYAFSRGGISFEDSAVPARNASVTAFLPGICVIPLVEGGSVRAFPIVSIGDTVKEGMLIGRGQGMGNVHATIPGKVIKIVSWKSASGQLNDALVIRLEGSFEKLGKREEGAPWEGMHPYDLQRLISEMGIVEMEGEGRPVSDLIGSLRNAPEPITMVVRCVFDDPWLASDYVLCNERTKAVVEGSRIMARIIKASRIIYAVSKNEKELGARFLAEAGNWDPPSMQVLVGSKYPQGNRRELEAALKNYGKKEGIEIGSCMILGPAELAAVYDAVKFRKPVLDRYIAVGGTSVKKAQIMKVRIGTRIKEVFAECGGFSARPGVITAGSPLSGRIITSLDEPVLKTTYALCAFHEKRGKSSAFNNCISCGECRVVCPVGLDPEELYKRTINPFKNNDEPPLSNAAECHGCCCCDVVCPSGLPLSSVISASAAASAAASTAASGMASGLKVS